MLWVDGRYTVIGSGLAAIHGNLPFRISCIEEIIWITVVHWLAFAFLKICWPDSGDGCALFLVHDGSSSWCVRALGFIDDPQIPGISTLPTDCFAYSTFFYIIDIMRPVAAIVVPIVCFTIYFSLSSRFVHARTLYRVFTSSRPVLPLLVIQFPLYTALSLLVWPFSERRHGHPSFSFPF